MFSSPARANCVTLEKKDTSVTLVMPVWSAEELQAAATCLQFDEQQVMDSFDIFGGVPRVVFPSTSGDRRKQALLDLTGASQQCDLKTVYAVGTLDADEHSHKILHRKLKRQEDNSPDDSEFSVDVASQSVCRNRGL